MPIRDPKKGKPSTSGPLSAAQVANKQAASNGVNIQWDASAFNTGVSTPTVYETPLMPVYARESDVWINPGSGEVSVYSNAEWQTVGRRSTAEFHQQTRCELSGTHHMNADSSVRYMDGTIVGYCKDCDVRMEMPFMSGGYDAVRLRDLGAALLVDPTDASQFNAFENELHKLVEHVHELNKAISEANCVEQVMFERWVSPDT